MNQLHLLTSSERQIFFTEAAAKLGISLPIVEKDFWVVWTLARLFSLEELKNHLTFKGGTSLSKVYSVIHRFSEDIDVSIEKDFLGFKENDPEKLNSKSKKSKVVEAISAACSSYVQNKMIADLKKEIDKNLKDVTENWKLVLDPRDPDGQTIQFEYPTMMSKESYIQPSVKIELGARAEHWPVSQHKIQSYAKEALGEVVDEPETIVRALNAERTFWEKATILHQYAHFPQGKLLPSRLSRHYYDFYCLLNAEVKKQAMHHSDLLERVAIHKSVYFASGWANYEKARRGTLKLIPSEPIWKELEKDYGLMKLMFFKEVPSWKAIYQKIVKFETDFNSGTVG